MFPRQHFYFEICLNKALLSMDSLQLLLKNSAYLLHILSEDRLIVTTGATSPLQMRSPADIMAILYMMGIKNPSAVLRENVINLLSRSSSRRNAGPAYAVLPSSYENEGAHEMAD